MKRQIGRGFKPPVIRAPDEVSPKAPPNGKWYDEIPTSSYLAGTNMDDYENIYERAFAKGGQVIESRDGHRMVKLDRELEECYDIHRDPSRMACYALQEARWCVPPITEQVEPIWSFTIHKNHECILWLPTMVEVPRIDRLGGQILTASHRPVRNATLTLSGSREYFRPVFGILYVGHQYT